MIRWASEGVECLFSFFFGVCGQPLGEAGSSETWSRENREEGLGTQ